MTDAPCVVKITKAEELNAVGAQLFGQGQLEPARLHFLAALALEPNNISALQNLGAVLRNMMHYEAAASVSRRSVALSKGENPFCRSNLGVSMLALKRYDEALDLLGGVVDDLPKSGHSWHNYGLALYMTGEYELALGAFDAALEFGDENPHCRSDRSLTLLALGRIQDGLSEYECRWQVLWSSPIWKTTIPEWKGEDLKERHILVHHEQGFGDSIMLVRFLKQLHANIGCRVTLCVPEELRRLFAFSLPYIHVITLDSPLLKSDEPAFDYHSPLLSVVRWLNVASPHEIDPTLYLRSGLGSDIKLPQAKITIGICWASGNHGIGLVERRRVINVTQFLPLTELEDVAVISLQKGDASKDLLSNGLEGLIFDVQHKLEDFADTAAVISQLDLVISVDSAVAHLAGALGKPCLMLSPYTRCWRWWNDVGLPWYEDMLIYSQARDGTWNNAMIEVIKEVKNRYML